MELRCAFVLVLVNIVVAHGYGIKGGGAAAQAVASAVATSGAGEVPLAVPVADGFSGSFSKSSSSSFASSSSSSSSSSFSYSGSGVGGLTSSGANGFASSGKGDCGTGTCQDLPNGLKDSDIVSNGLQTNDGTATGTKANAFSGSSAYSQNGGQTPCSGERCLPQGSPITGSNANSVPGSSAYSQNGLPCTGESCSTQGALSGSQANSFSGSSTYSQYGDQKPCKGENCSPQGVPTINIPQKVGQEPCSGATCLAQGNTITHANENSFTGSTSHSQNDGNTPCVEKNCSHQKEYDCEGSNCNAKSNTPNDCASGLCGQHSQTGSVSNAPVEIHQNTESAFDSSIDQSSTHDGSSIHFKPVNSFETKFTPNSATSKQNHANSYGSSDQSSKYEGNSNGYGSVSGCSNGNCGLPVPSPQSKPTYTYNNPAGQYRPTLTSGAAVPIPSTFLTTPKETSNQGTLCTAPGCDTPEVGDYPGTENLPSSYSVPIYPTEIKNPITSFGNKDVACTSGNCENYPLNDSKMWPNNLKADSVYEELPSKTEPKDYTGSKCSSLNCGISTSDVKVTKSPSTSYTTPQIHSANGAASCTTGNCASHLLIPVPTVDSFNKPGSQLPIYTTVPLSSQPHKPESFILTGGEPNCASGNCAGHHSSPVFAGTGNFYTGAKIPSGSQGNPSYNLAGHISPTSCTGINCAKYPLHQLNEPAPTKNPSYSFTTLPLSNSPSQPLGTTLPSYNIPSGIYTHGTQPPHQNLPTSFGIGSNLKPSQVNNKATGDATSNEKLPVYSGGFGGPSGFLSPHDFTIPSKPLAPQQRPPVKPVYPYDGSLAPPTSTANIPVPTSQKIPCTSGICGSSPTLSTSQFGHISSASAATAAAHSESKEVAYTGGFGGPPGFLAPYDNNKKTEGFGHSGLNTKRPQAEKYHPLSLPVGNGHPSYGGPLIGSGINTKPIANAQLPTGANPIHGGYQGQTSLGTTSPGCNGGNCGLKRPSYGGSSHFGLNSNNLPNPSQPNQYSGSQPNSIHDISLSGSGSHATVGTIAGATGSTNSVALSGSKTKQNGIAGGCGSSDCSARGDTSLHDQGNVVSGLLNSGSPPTGVLTSAAAQSGAFSVAGNENQLGGCSGGCNSNGGSLGGGNGQYGAAAVAKSSASATSGVGADQFGLDRSFANSFAAAHASSGSAVKGGYGKR